MTTREKLAALRVLMKKHGLTAYYVPSVDPHQSEYLPECWKRRAWLSGFTGSAGDLVVTLRKAGLWTDGRYYLQAEQELKGSGITLMKLGQPETPELMDWVAKQLKPGQSMGVDPQVLSVAGAEAFEETLGDAGSKVRYISRNLVDQLWKDQPEPSLAPIKIHSSRYAGEGVRSKLKRLREAMKEQGAQAHVMGTLDTIAWLFNIRSADILYTPVAIAYAVVTDRGATIFTDMRKVAKGTAKALAKNAKFVSYTALPDTLHKLGKRRAKVLIDPATTNRWVQGHLRGAEIVHGASPVVMFKAIKNDTQVAGFRDAMVRDGVAMVKFLRWLQKAVPRGGVTEMSAAQKLDGFRAEDNLFFDCSFETISGYRGNGAIIHYAVSEESDVKLRPRGIYLIDSGGQYPDGTTDITRTVTLGKPTPREREMFTRVLKGTIQCTITPFPAGTTGQRHELFARQALWKAGANYMHGTGHGVGHFLGVHEGPASLKDIPTVPLEPGMILSIEPGVYQAGKFGIRTENLALVVRDKKLSRNGQDWYHFDTLTLCPIDLRLIDRKLLTATERKWLNQYHQLVYRKLNRHLDTDHKNWLLRATRGI
jgi:Xaa-Pro aminopeptidase